MASVTTETQPPHPALPARRFFRLLLWVQWRSLCARVRGVRRESPLLLFVLAAFVLSYLGMGYWLFHAGLDYLHHFPLVGSLLSQRILFLIFGFFFVMLVFSNLIIGYSTLFRNRETQWFLSLPVTHRDIYHWKFFEALVISSWALVFLSAPMMVAYGQVHDVPLIFYVQIALVYVPFVIIPALFGSWLILFLVRVLARPIVQNGLAVLGVASVLTILFVVNPVTDADALHQDDVLSFDQLLRHTRLSVNPYLPSAWLAKSVLSWGEGLTTQGAFFFLLLLSNAMMGMLIGFELMGRLFYGSWTVALSSRAERFQRKAEARRRGAFHRSLIEWVTDFIGLFSRPYAALVLKDVRLFWRDPTQWIQFMIFFGLLCIYVLNLRNVAFNFHSDFWETMISYLNLGASALTLSTLTTRFVFPQFSLEGRRLWLLGLAPVGLHRILLQKFWLSCLTAMTITVSLNVASSVLLHMSWSKLLFFAMSIALMATALSGLAVGLGAVFPNFKEDNPSKIVSGFGGTLCLVISFIYISVFVALLAVRDLRRVNLPIPISDSVALALALVLSLGILFIPMVAATHRVKNVQI
jgi:ABC-2 type transport system permease protein